MLLPELLQKGGRDLITAAIITGEDKEKLGNKMVELRVRHNPEANTKESMYVRNADDVVLIGAQIEEKMVRCSLKGR